MKKEDFYGKCYLRDGDLMPVIITEDNTGEIITDFKGSVRWYRYLQDNHLLFDNWEDAISASQAAISLVVGIRNHTIVREEDIAEAYPPKKRIYISGPISGHDIEERRKVFKMAQTFLEAQDYDVVNPMENGLPAEVTTREHMKRDIELLMTCDCIYMMRRWTHSKGCKVEFDVATAIGLPVYFEEASELIKFE